MTYVTIIKPPATNFSIKVNTKDATSRNWWCFSTAPRATFGINAFNGPDVVIEGLSAHYQ